MIWGVLHHLSIVYIYISYKLHETILSFGDPWDPYRWEMILLDPGASKVIPPFGVDGTEPLRNVLCHLLVPIMLQ